MYWPWSASYCDGSFIRLPVLAALHQKLLSCEQLSIPSVSIYSFCNQTTVTSQITHDTQGQYSRLHMPSLCLVRPGRRKIRLIEYNAKCRYPKKLACKGTLRQVFICLRPRTPYTHCIRVYSILIHTEKRGRGFGLERKLERQQFTKLGRKYQHDWLI